MTRALLGALALLALCATPASAAADLEATFQDDNELVYVDKQELQRNLDVLQGLGVDRLRITVLWKAIAPEPDSRTKPPFDASDPDRYPAGVWDNYVNVVEGARARGMDVNFNVTGPAPLWATRPAPREDIVDSYEPSPAEFGAFVGAVARKFPGVRYWSIWNEPNHSGWLTPTWDVRDGAWVERSASLYRELLAAAWSALGATGHGADTILIGETAPSGDRSKDVKRYMKPLIFVRALYCVDEALRPLQGAAAARLDCPADPAQLPAQHPALFAASGFAHHPYQLLTAPTVKPRDPEYVTIAVLGRLTKALDRIFARYGSARRLDLYLTEYGYQTYPDLFGVTYGRQSAYLNRSEYMAWRNKRVRTLAQFLLNDDGSPIPLTFQSGLRTNDGRDKPSLRAYRMPIHVSGRGRWRGVWGIVRPAAAGEPAAVEIQYRRKDSKRWRRLRDATAGGARNVLQAKVRLPRGRGHVRTAWNGRYSRAAAVRVR